ncbi:MAG TPA: hypothetical protein VNZ44_13130 [Pyrinomonadaceae bacterium]|nr:hypothetical protein [Pyrinomonadaceae bacterium]
MTNSERLFSSEPRTYQTGPRRGSEIAPRALTEAQRAEEKRALLIDRIVTRAQAAAVRELGWEVAERGLDHSWLAERRVEDEAAQHEEFHCRGLDVAALEARLSETPAAWVDRRMPIVVRVGTVYRVDANGVHESPAALAIARLADVVDLGPGESTDGSLADGGGEIARIEWHGESHAAERELRRRIDWAKYRDTELPHPSASREASEKQR